MRDFERASTAFLCPGTVAGTCIGEGAGRRQRFSQLLRVRTRRALRTSPRRKAPNAPSRLQANRGKPSGSENPLSPDDRPDKADLELLESLRRRVQELYNGEEAPSATSSSRGQEPPPPPPPLPALRRGTREKAVEHAAEAERERSQAFFVVASIFFLSVLSGAVFVYLYDIGAVHGGGHRVNYKTPTYGTETYINPYELLERESFSD